MASKPMRLTDYAERTALRYGKSVSEGIKEMEFIISHFSTPKEKFQNTPIPDDYWKKFKATVDDCIERAKRY